MIYVDIDAEELASEIGALIEASDLDAFIDARVTQSDEGLEIEYPHRTFKVTVEEV